MKKSNSKKAAEKAEFERAARASSDRLVSIGLKASKAVAQYAEELHNLFKLQEELNAVRDKPENG